MLLNQNYIVLHLLCAILQPLGGSSVIESLWLDKANAYMK